MESQNELTEICTKVDKYQDICNISQERRNIKPMAR